MEICCVELETKSSKLIILSLYRAPTGDFNHLLKYLDDALKHLYKPKQELWICADINTDYLIESYWIKWVTSLLTTYNLLHAVDMQWECKITAIDNVLIDNGRRNLSSVSPIINGLSDYNAWILTKVCVCVCVYIYATVNKVTLKQRTRLINNETVMSFKTPLKNRNMGIHV